MKRGVKIGIILASVAAIAAATIAANIARSRSQVHGIDVSIRTNRTPQLVDEQTIADSILAIMPKLYMTHVNDIDRGQVAEAAMAVPYVEEATAAVSVSGKVVIKAKQRRPIARLIYGGREMYIDKFGAIFPTSKLADCNILVMGGDFREPLKKDSLNSQMTDLLAVANFLDNNSNYAILIDQIYSERDGDIMMVSKLGDNVIELGTTEDLEEKFSNLWTFYRKGMPRAGWETYNRISLKYKGQVVCTKNKQ